LDRDMANAFEGSYQPCMRDAYNGQFHHDWARNKGNAHFSMSFDPPVTGCYKIEEYHPGSDYSCSRYLPRNAELNIDYCQGMSKTLQINQAVQGAQWNEIDRLPFHKGHQGKFTMKNKQGEQCDTGSCFWVADAFRLTWVANECNTTDSASSHMINAPEVATLQQEQAESQATTADATKGLLLLRASFDKDNEGSLLDLQVKLRDHASVLESSLSLHLGGIHVTITDIALTSRRLQLTGHSTSPVGIFRVSFVAHSRDISELNDSLSHRLQVELQAAGAGVDIASADVEWPELVNTQKSVDDETSDINAALIVGGAVGAVVLAACVGVSVVVARLRYKKAQKLVYRQKNLKLKKVATTLHTMQTFQANTRLMSKMGH